MAVILPENGVCLEAAPCKRAIEGKFFFHVRGPPGNRVALAKAGAHPILAPGREPPVWIVAGRRKRRAFGLKTIGSFRTHGTPPAKKARAIGAPGAAAARRSTLPGPPHFPAAPERL